MLEKGGEIISSIQKFGGLGLSMFGKSVSIGVDVGSKSIKVVELGRKKGSVFLKNFVIAKATEDLVRAGSSGVLIDSAGEAIKKTLAEGNVSKGKLNVSVPSFSSLITTIEIPNMSKDEIEKVVQIEAPKYIPVKLDDVVYGWQIVEEAVASSQAVASSGDKKDGNKIKVLVVAIMKEISQQYEKVFGSAELEIDSLEIDSFSLQRGLIKDPSGCSIILDMGNKVSNILVVSNSNILLNRTVDVAGEKMTEAIARSLNIDNSRAEQYKIENGIQSGSRDGGVLLQMADVLAGEISQTIEIFKESYPQKDPQKIILSGGGAYMKGLEEFISREIGIEAVLGDPFFDIGLPEGGKEALKSYGPLLSSALGLARLGFEGK